MMPWQCSAGLIGLMMVSLTSRAASQEKAAIPPGHAKLLPKFVEEFVNIDPGSDQFPESFTMGSPHNDQEQPVHRVTIVGDFAIAKYEVPQNLYEAVMGDNPSRWKGLRNSAEMMTWQEANEFCQHVTTLLHDANLIDASEVIRLPTEAEWEYCCRARTNTAYSFGNDATADGDTGKTASRLDPYAWHTGNAAGNDPPVGALKPNPWGLYDIHGYLWEFTADNWHDSYVNAPSDGAAWTSAKQEPDRIVIRGGSWKDAAPHLRSAARRPFATDARNDAVGFRCVKAKVSP